MNEHRKMIDSLLDETFIKAIREYPDGAQILKDLKFQEKLMLLQKKIDDGNFALDDLRIVFDELAKKLGHESPPIPKTRQPKKHISPKDKVTNLLFKGGLGNGIEHLIGTEKKGSKKQLDAIVSISFDNLKDLEIMNVQEPTQYDREVHDAVVSLYVEGGNEFITPLMIYRTMTGNPRASLNEKSSKEISDSITKCSITRIRIDASAEVKAWGFDKPKYEGNLLYTKKIIGTYEGKESEWIHVMERPVLYDYALQKKQIATHDIKLLNTPVNKNRQMIELQSFLLRRIDIMRNGTKISKNIRFISNKDYEGIYEMMGVKSAVQQKRTRDSIFSMLDYWKQEKHIKGYRKNMKGKSIESITILL